MSLRRYLTILQDPQGYGAPGTDDAPPDGPTPPVLLSVVSADESDAVVAELEQEVKHLREQLEQS